VAKGDPHLQNIHGEKFDLMQPGKHTLLQIPRQKSVEVGMPTLLLVRALAARMGPQCADMYFSQVNITGAWAEKKQAGGFQYNALDGSDDRQSRWVSVGNVHLKVVRGQTRQGIRYLNFYTMHLGRVGFPIGGLLGEDDHSAEATKPKNCEHRVVLHLASDTDRSAFPRSFAEASLA